MKLTGNKVLITGGATGIGLAMAEAFLDAGSDVMICGRRADRLAEVKARRTAIHTCTCDVASSADRLALVDHVRATWGGLDVLVNNAGIQRDVDFTRGVAELEAGPSEIAINLEAPVVLAGLFVPLLTGRENARIVNVTSGLGFVPAAKMPVYSATKAALHAFSMALRFQLAKVGIEVVEVIPPAVDTELNAEGRAKRGGFKPPLKAEPFVADVMKGLANDAPEIGYGPSESWRKASRAELDEAFVQVNSRM